MKDIGYNETVDRLRIESKEDFPVVGDWVALINHDSDFTIIHKILPRLSSISRQAVGKFGEKQIMAANVDYAFIIQAIDRDFSINRLERYLTICYSSKVSPIIILTKIDLIDNEELNIKINEIKTRLNDIPVFAVSNKTQNGYEVFKQTIKKGKTYCLLGSSGVGKSTLINNLACKTIMKTDSISNSTNKGRHTTSHR